MKKLITLLVATLLLSTGVQAKASLDVNNQAHMEVLGKVAGCQQYFYTTGQDRKGDILDIAIREEVNSDLNKGANSWMVMEASRVLFDLSRYGVDSEYYNMCDEFYVRIKGAL